MKQILPVQEKASTNANVHAKSCVICGNSATRLVDGEPSCDKHAELVYEDQLARYTQQHIGEER